jgi:tetratricopeptide (TPR) repeat protein
LNWYGDETTQADAAAYLKPNPEDRNVSPWQLSDYVNDFTGLRSTVHSGGNIELLKRLIAAGFPVVIEKGYEPNTSGSIGWFGHYLTVFAFDENEQVFYSMDTYLRVDEQTGRADSYQEIEDYWREFNYTFYVVYRPEQEQEVFRIIGQDLLDPTTMWEKTAQRAQADIDLNPDDAFAWYNLGTSLTRLGEITGEAEFYQNGAAAFDQARTIGLPPRMLWYEFRPYLAYMKTGRYEDMIELADSILASQGGQNVEETYLYKGHALLYKGDVAGATAAYQRALQLNENFYPAEIALQSIG